jgi:hypothetical protein
LKQLCKSITGLVVPFFDQDVAPSVLQVSSTCTRFKSKNLYRYQKSRAFANFRDKIKDFKGIASIPILESNTPAAKSMRIAIALALLTQLLSARLLTSTYLIPDDSDLRIALSHEADNNAEKEVLCRGVLLGINTEHQAQNREERVTEVLEIFTEVSQTLYPSSSVLEFKVALEPLLQDLTELWWKIQRCKQPVMADAELESLRELFEEDLLTMSLPSDQEDSTKKDTPDGNLEVAVLFPSIYPIAGEDVYIRGCVLRQWQLWAAQQEQERAAQEKSALARIKGSKSRRSSGTGTPAETPSQTKESFLDQEESSTT